MSKIFPFTETGYPPPENLRPGIPPPPKNLRLGTPPPKSETGYPPPRNVNRQTPVKTVPSCHTTYAGGNNTGIQLFTERVGCSPTRPTCNWVRKTENRDTELKTLTEWIFQLAPPWIGLV